jgi:dolichol-phosphate mannosyltransferase
MEWGFFRRLISKGANLYARVLLDLPIRDVTSGFRAFDREAIKVLSETVFLSRGYALQVEVVYILKKMGFKVVEVPFVFGRRVYGRSKLGLGSVLEYLYNVLRLRLG